MSPISRIRAAFSGPLALAELACWLLPPLPVKNRLLNRFGHRIAASAVLWPSVVVGVRRAEIGEHAHLGLLNVIRGLSLLRLDAYARIDSWNWISAHPSYQELDPSAGTLFMATCSRIGSRCYLDCSGTIVLRHYGFVGGHQCLLYTHAPDYVGDSQTIGRITIGHHSMMCSRGIALAGAFLPEHSLLAANSLLMEASAADRRPGLYVGNPAVWKRETTGDWFVRRTYSTHGHYMTAPMGVLSDDETPPEFTTPPIDFGIDSKDLLPAPSGEAPPC